MQKKSLILLTSLFLLVGCNPTNTSSVVDSSSSSSSQDSSSQESTSKENSSSSQASSSTSELKATNLFLVGDSTVCSFDDNYYFPRYGYGTQIGNYLSDKVTVNNLALSGRSSKSFLAEANYQTLKDSIKEGDYLLIGFGHNDEKNEVARYTNPNGDVNTEGSFQKSLYDNYVKLALDKGATPILATPIVRFSETNEYTGNNIHQTSTTDDNFPGGDYSKAIIDLATSKNIAYVDLTALTKNQWSTVGSSQARKYHAQITTQENTLDKTHINKYGANVVSYLLTSNLLNSDCSFKDYIKTDISFPSEQTYYVSNPDYVESTYVVPTASSTIFTDVTSPWMASVFGDVGGANKISKDKFNIVQTDSTINIKVGIGSAAGKISSTSDGIAMCFQKISKNQDFTLKATMKLTSYQTGNDQVGFGLMLRDDMYIDTFSSNVNANYVAAGGVKLSKGNTTNFSRVNSTLKIDKTVDETPYALDTEVELELTRVGNTITSKVGDNTFTYTDFNLTGVDSEYDYVGVFAARQADVTYTNVSLELK